MTLIRKLFVLFAFAVLWAPTACKEESAKKEEGDTHPAIADLLQAIEDVEIGEARGMVLASASPDDRQVFKRIVKRSKIGAGLLRKDDASVDGLTELVRSRDELQTLIFLSEDVDVIAAYRTALDKAVRALCLLQGRHASDLGDPNVYREIYSQDFNLEQKLGDFSTFIESRTTKGPKLFEAGTCGDACGKLEYIITDVNKSQAVWLVSARISLPDTKDLKLVLSGSIKGEASNATTKGLRIYASETFDGNFTTVEGNWVDITDLLDRYPANGTTSFKAFDASMWLDQFRGKSLTLAIRVQGTSTSQTTYQLNKLAVLGKGTAPRTVLTLTAPAPLLLDTPSTGPTNTPNPGTGTNPGNSQSTGVAYDGIAKVCALVNGVFDIKESCRIPFDSATAENDYLAANAPIPLTKVYVKGGKLETTPGLRAAWRVSRPEIKNTNCVDKVTTSELISGVCVLRSSATTASGDLLLTPKIKLEGNYTIKIWHAPYGVTVNRKKDGSAVTASKRFRTLIFSKEDLNTKEEFDVPAFVAKLASENANGAALNSDVPFSKYPAAERVEAVLTESILDKDVLSAKLGSGSEFQLGLLQNLMGDGAAGDNTSSWYVYAITFVKN